MKLMRRLLRKGRRALSCGPVFTTKDVEIGRNVSFGRNVAFNCSRVRIGDGVIFRDNVVVNADEFEIGDYGTIYDNCFFPGPGKLTIGHNFWLGTACIVDSQGGTTIGNNVGAGAHSQLWTHMKFGDVMYGCRFDSSKPLIVEDDVWLVGHCLVSPVRLGARSIAMLGSLITRNMEADRCYAGVPAKDVTEKFGSQFKVTSIEERIEYLQRRIDQLAASWGQSDLYGRVRIVAGPEAIGDHGEGVTVFDVASRTYLKQGTGLEHRLIRALLPDAKFTPATLSAPVSTDAESPSVWIDRHSYHGKTKTSPGFQLLPM